VSRLREEIEPSQALEDVLLAWQVKLLREDVADVASLDRVHAKEQRLGEELAFFRSIMKQGRKRTGTRED
jgi:hypothetical protein